MKTILELHNEEQLEAILIERLEWFTHWKPIEQDYRQKGFTPKAIAILEIKEWTTWKQDRRKQLL